MQQPIIQNLGDHFGKVGCRGAELALGTTSAVPQAANGPQRAASKGPGVEDEDAAEAPGDEEAAPAVAQVVSQEQRELDESFTGFPCHYFTVDEAEGMFDTAYGNHWSPFEDEILQREFWTHCKELILQNYLRKNTRLRPLSKLMLWRYGCHLYDLFTYELKFDPRYPTIRVDEVNTTCRLPFPGPKLCESLRTLLSHPIWGSNISLARYVLSYAVYLRVPGHIPPFMGRKTSGALERTFARHTNDYEKTLFLQEVYEARAHTQKCNVSAKHWHTSSSPTVPSQTRQSASGNKGSSSCSMTMSRM